MTRRRRRAERRRRPGAVAVSRRRGPPREAERPPRPTPAREARNRRNMSRLAHPAGPRHADVLPAEHAPIPPDDLNALDPAIWPRSARRADGALTIGRDRRAGPGRAVRHPGVRPGRGGLPRPVPRVRPGVRRAGGGVLRGQGVLLPRGTALGRRGRPWRGRVHRRRARGRAGGRGRPGHDHHARQQQAPERARARGGHGRGSRGGRLVRGDRPAGLRYRGTRWRGGRRPAGGTIVLHKKTLQRSGRRASLSG